MPNDAITSKNPLPHLGEATRAAAKIISIGRDLAVLNAELKAAEQVHRVAWAAATVVFALLFLFLPVLWITIDLHERGWSGLMLAGVCALIFGTFGAFSAWMTRNAFFEVRKNLRRRP